MALFKAGEEIKAAPTSAPVAESLPAFPDLTNCSGCGKPVHREAEVCFNCGKRYKLSREGVVLTVFLVLGIVGAVLSMCAAAIASTHHY